MLGTRVSKVQTWAAVHKMGSNRQTCEVLAGAQTVGKEQSATFTEYAKDLEAVLELNGGAMKNA